MPEPGLSSFAVTPMLGTLFTVVFAADSDSGCAADTSAVAIG